MKTMCITIAALLFAQLARSEEIKLANGQIIKGDISRVEPDGLVLMTDAGIEKVSFLLLDEAAQKRFGFDLKKADEYRAQQRALRQQMVEAQAAALRAKQERLAERQFDESKMVVDAVILQVLKDGVMAKLFTKVKTDGTEYVTLPPATALDRNPRVVARPTSSESTQMISERAMIFGTPKGLADEDIWQGAIWPAGTYSYESVGGSRKTLRAYATSLELAKAKLSEQQ